MATDLYRFSLFTKKKTDLQQDHGTQLIRYNLNQKGAGLIARGLDTEPYMATKTQTGTPTVSVTETLDTGTRLAVYPKVFSLRRVLKTYGTVFGKNFRLLLKYPLVLLILPRKP